MDPSPPLRSRIVRAFNDEELRAFCFDHFPSVYTQFTIGMTQGQMVGLLLDYCMRYQAGETLLDALEQVRQGLVGADRDALLVWLEGARFDLAQSGDDSTQTATGITNARPEIAYAKTGRRKASKAIEDHIDDRLRGFLPWRQVWVLGSVVLGLLIVSNLSYFLQQQRLSLLLSNQNTIRIRTALAYTNVQIAQAVTQSPVARNADTSTAIQILPPSLPQTSFSHPTVTIPPTSVPLSPTALPPSSTSVPLSPTPLPSSPTSVPPTIIEQPPSPPTDTPTSTPCIFIARKEVREVYERESLQKSIGCPVPSKNDIRASEKRFKSGAIYWQDLNQDGNPDNDKMYIFFGTGDGKYQIVDTKNLPSEKAPGSNDIFEDGFWSAYIHIIKPDDNTYNIGEWVPGSRQEISASLYEFERGAILFILPTENETPITFVLYNYRDSQGNNKCYYKEGEEIDSECQFVREPA